MVASTTAWLRVGTTVALLSAIAIRILTAVVATALCHIHFATDDGFYVALLGLLKEICRREHVAVIGDGHRRHLLTGSFIEQFPGFAGAVEQTVIGVNVKMNELRLPHKFNSKTLVR